MGGELPCFRLQKSGKNLLRAGDGLPIFPAPFPLNKETDSIACGTDN